MATNLLWFVMAGFLLGFATSTLWEWFYFRKERLKLTDRRILELEAKLQEAELAKSHTPPVNPLPMQQSVQQAGPHETPQSAQLPTSVIPTVDSVTGRSRTSAWGESIYRSPGVFLESEEFDEEPDEITSSDDERSRFAPTATNHTNHSPTRLPTSVTQQTAPPTIPSTFDDPTVPTSQPPLDAPASKPLSASQTAHSSPLAAPADASSDSQIIPRGDQLAPADALRAKRGGGARSRQEVLAELRRNSEAVRRGEQIPAEKPSKSEPGRYDGSNFAFVPPSPLPPKVQPDARDPGDSAVPGSVGEGGEVPQPKAAANEPPVHAPLAMSPERARWMNDPELTARTQGYPDDLSKIKGIGDVYKYRLYRAGFYTWQQIADADTEVLRRATSAYPSSNIEEWLAQAKKLIEKHGRQNATYEGPVPDDMTKILGIGPVSASVLYRTGICTYEQLAVTSVAELESLFPIAVAGDQPDFAQWVGRAAELADEKHRA